MLKQIIINGITITEGEKFIHNITGVTYEIKKSLSGVLKFDNDIIHVNITADRLNQVTKILI